MTNEEKMLLKMLRTAGLGHLTTLKMREAISVSFGYSLVELLVSRATNEEADIIRDLYHVCFKVTNMK